MDNRSKLLSEALNLFSDRGFDAVGVQEIVNVCGVKKPTLYHYFKNKIGLLETIFSENFVALKNQISLASEYKHDITNNLNQITKTFFEYAKEHQKFYRMQLSMYFSPPENEVHQIAIKYNKELHDLLEEMFKNAVKDHGNFRDREGLYAATYLGMVNTYIGMFLNRYVEIDEALIYRLVHQFMHGIFS